MQSNEYLNTLSSQIMDIVRQQSNGRHTIPLGEISLNLKEKNGIAIDLKKYHANLMKRKPHKAHGVVFTNSKNSKPVDPLELTIISKKNDEVLKGIKDKIKVASANQLPKSMPGIIVCFLEDISAIELQDLASDSGLQIISNYILDKSRNDHIAAISYCSEERILDFQTHQRFDFQGLVFNNPNCIFPNVKDFEFITFGQS